MLIHEAIEFAAVKHRNQVRKGTDTPYIVHPMEVMYILAENGCDDTVVARAQRSKRSKKNSAKRLRASLRRSRKTNRRAGRNANRRQSTACRTRALRRSSYAVRTNLLTCAVCITIFKKSAKSCGSVSTRRKRESHGITAASSMLSPCWKTTICIRN